MDSYLLGLLSDSELNFIDHLSASAILVQSLVLNGNLSLLRYGQLDNVSLFIDFLSSVRDTRRPNLVHEELPWESNHPGSIYESHHWFPISIFCYEE